MTRLRLNRETLRRLDCETAKEVQGGLIVKKPLDSTPEAGCWTFWKCLTWNCNNTL